MIFSSVLICLLALNVNAQDSGSEMSEADKNWMTYMTPGDMHKMMASWDGEWTETITMWMDPEAPPTKSEAGIRNQCIQATSEVCRSKVAAQSDMIMR